MRTVYCGLIFVSRRPGFDPRSVHLRFMVDKVTPGHVFLRTLRGFSCQNSTLLRTHLHLHVAPTRRTNGRSLASFHKAMVFRESGNIEEKRVFTFFCLYLHWVNAGGTCSGKTQYAT